MSQKLDRFESKKNYDIPSKPIIRSSPILMPQPIQKTTVCRPNSFTLNMTPPRRDNLLAHDRFMKMDPPSYGSGKRND